MCKLSTGKEMGKEISVKPNNETSNFAILNASVLELGKAVRITL
jgi:hypothetical protein